MTKTPHTSFRRGTHVFVILRNGEMFDDNYVEKTKKSVTLRERGQIFISDIRSLSYFKNTPNKKEETSE